MPNIKKMLSLTSAFFTNVIVLLRISPTLLVVSLGFNS